MGVHLGDAGLFAPNRVTSATLSNGAGSWSSSFPITNAGTDELASVARSTDATALNTKFRVDLGVARYVRAFWIRYHNLKSTAQWKWLGGTTAGGSDVYNGSFVNVWRLSVEPGLSSIGMEDDGLYDGTVFDAFFVLPAFTSARYWDCHITDTTNPAGYIQIGRVGIAGGFIPRYGLDVNVMHLQNDLSGRTRAASGADWKTSRPIQRGADITFNALSAEEGVRARHLANLIGTTDGVYYAPSISDLETTQREGFYGTLAELPKVRYPYQTLREAGFRVVEQMP